VDAGTHKASSIKVAEASKVIENSQRDLNIAFVNELALIFEKMNIDTIEVLEAAGTKWNFLPFRPGLVGGHCIGVDPYYLTHKAQALGYHPEVILAGRRINDNMGVYVANKTIKLMIKEGQRIRNSKVLVLGFTFKENCPDIRNTRVVDIVEELNEFGCDVEIYDPWVDAEEVKEEYGIDIITKHESLDSSGYDAIIAAVAHDSFKNLDINRLRSHNESVVYDIKSVFSKRNVSDRL